MTVMVVAHPIPGFNGRQYVDDVALTFVGGFAKADVPTGAQADLTARGYTLNAVPASNYDPRYVTQDDLETPTSAASVALKAAFVSVLIYSGSAYPTRPSAAPGGLVKYIGPVQPTDWLAGDEWVNNS